MKVVFCSNYMNHHQLYFSKVMLNNCDEYKFIACTPFNQERLKLGYVDMNKQFDWIVRMYEDDEQYNEAIQLIQDADLVIVGGGFPNKLIRKRILLNKPVFWYTERIYKNGSGDISESQNLHNYLSYLYHYKYMNFRKVYVLAASAYTPYDLSIYHNFKNKCYKWGYFPYVEKYDLDRLIESKNANKPIKLLWCARMIGWKHPEYIIYLAERLKKENIPFEINMIGVGEEMDNIKTQIKELGLGDNVHLLGSMPTEKVREYMLQSNIFLFTSDFNEGWGAVLNEAMNSACAVVVSHAIGAAPFLIDDKKNGLMYTYGNKEEFYNIVKELILNNELRESISKEAYYTIVNEWNPENAAKRVLMLYDKLINKKDITIESGVCSKADVLDNYWRK